MANLRRLAVLAARRYGIDPQIFLRQIAQESGFDPRARSSAGALGVAQFMPATARGMGVDPLDPRSALFGAARMDAENLHKYGNWQDVLSLYNSGRGWSQGRNIAETRNYVASILHGRGSGAVSQNLTLPAPTQSSESLGPVKAQLAQSLIAASQASARGQQPDYADVFALLRKGSSASADVAASPDATLPATTTGATKRGRLAELFYDPAGFYVKNGQDVRGAIGGHSDHVHVASLSAQTMLAAIAEARKLGLHASENPLVGPVHHVHVGNSFHYRVIGSYRGRKIGAAADVSGDPARMAAFFRWASRNL